MDILKFWWAFQEYIIGFLPLKKKGTLLYLGMHKGKSFELIFRQYKTCYGFEANPDFYKQLQKKYKKYANVHIINAAVSTENGTIPFNISSNKGESSSIGVFKEEWGKEISMIKEIQVPSINLFDFIQEKGITFIDSYISDIQGADLKVLKTLRPMIEQGLIREITCEVVKDEFGNIYKNISANNEKGFDELLAGNYQLVATGWGVLKDGVYEKVPDDWWEMDCKWVLHTKKIKFD